MSEEQQQWELGCSKCEYVAPMNTVVEPTCPECGAALIDRVRKALVVDAGSGVLGRQLLDRALALLPYDFAQAPIEFRVPTMQVQRIEDLRLNHIVDAALSQDECVIVGAKGRVHIKNLATRMR